jgi:hypothetical protein
MGIVYLARDETLGRHVAVKMVRPLDPTLLERTLHEAGLREAFVWKARLGAQLTHRVGGRF